MKRTLDIHRCQPCATKGAKTLKFDDTKDDDEFAGKQDGDEDDDEEDDDEEDDDDEDDDEEDDDDDVESKEEERVSVIDDNISADRMDKRGSRHCCVPLCTKRSTWGPIGGARTSARYCSKHGRENGSSVNVQDKRCEVPGCKLSPSFGPAGGNRSSAICCSTHGNERGLVNVWHKQCEAPGCTLSPSFGPTGGNRSSAICCSTHGNERGFVNVWHKQCEAPGCKLRPSFGPTGGNRSSAICCSTHGNERGLVNVINQCEAPGCTIFPCYGIEGGRREFCYTHSDPRKHMNVVHKRCATCTLLPAKFIHPNSKTKQCLECDPRIRAKTKQKEIVVKRVLEAAFKDDTVIRELFVSFCGGGSDRTECGRTQSLSARCDFVLYNEHAVVVVEVDEDQHKHYCRQREIARAQDIVVSLIQGGNPLPVTVIRFNPDAFKIDKKTRRIPSQIRHAKLVEVIRDGLKSNAPHHTWSLVYMYYDCDADGLLCIMDDIPEEIREICLAPIIT